MTNYLKNLTFFLTAGLLSGPALAASECAGQPIQAEMSPQVVPAGPQKVRIQADEITFPRSHVVHLRGYTQLVRGGHRVYADELIYNKKANAVEARGVVKFQSPNGDEVRTSVLRYDIVAGTVVSGPAEFVIAARHTSVLGSGDHTVNAHGTAEQVVFERDNIMRLENAVVTTCLDGRDDITFTAQDIRVDLDQGVRTARRARMQILAPDRHTRLREIIN